MKKRNAFTLVELMIVMSIIAIMTVILIGVFNTIGVNNKGRDAQRKKDIRRIKIALEEYFSDKGSFPDTVLLDQLNDKANCGNDVFAPYLNTWPCDPKGNPYVLTVGLDNNFKIITNLENKKDKDIPEGWYSESNTTNSDLKDIANYGVSSSNILWYEPYEIAIVTPEVIPTVAPSVNPTAVPTLTQPANLSVNCFIKDSNDICVSRDHCEAPNCYQGSIENNDCSPSNAVIDSCTSR